MGAFLSEVFNEMAAILLLYAVIGIKLKQSLIVAFGIIVGPSVLNWVSSNDKVDLIAKLSIAILLFLVGLKLDLHIIKNNGPSGTFRGHKPNGLYLSFRLFNRPSPWHGHLKRHLRCCCAYFFKYQYHCKTVIR